MPAISSSSLSASSSPGRGASGASNGLSDIGAGVKLEGFCGEAEDVLGSILLGEGAASKNEDQSQLRITVLDKDW